MLLARHLCDLTAALRQRSWLALALLLPLLAPLAGCRNDPFTAAFIESVNAENRELEDWLYRKEYELEALRAKLARLEQAGAAPGAERRPAGLFDRSRSTPGDPSPPDLSPPRIETPSLPSIEIPGESSPAPRPVRPPSLPPPPPPGSTPALNNVRRPAAAIPDEPPVLEAPEPPPPGNSRAAPSSSPQPASSGSVPSRSFPSPSPALPALPAPPEQDDAPLPPANELPPPPAANAPEAVRPKVTQLFLNPLATSGEDLDRQPGDDGVSVLIEPRSAAGQFVPEAGAVSVVLLDPARQGDDARVARWDLDAAAVRGQLNTLAGQRGIRLQLPWPGSPPSSSQLKLFVRMELADGQKLQAERDIFVTLPGQFSNRWTPRSPLAPREELSPRTFAPAPVPTTTVPTTPVSAPRAGLGMPLPSAEPAAESATAPAEPLPPPAASASASGSPAEEIGPPPAAVETPPAPGPATSPPPAGDNSRSPRPQPGAGAVLPAGPSQAPRLLAPPPELGEGVKARRPEWKPFR